MGNPKKPLGWRKRIGVLSPTVMETACHDFYKMPPDGVSICAISGRRTSPLPTSPPPPSACSRPRRRAGGIYILYN